MGDAVPVEFIRKEVTVTLDEGEERLPRSFKLGGKEYQVAEVLASWQDHGYSGLPAAGRRRGQAGWQGGTQRQFFRIRTEEGDVFEVYVEAPAGRRGAGLKPRWYAHRRITGAAAAGPPPSGEPSG